MGAVVREYTLRIQHEPGTVSIYSDRPGHGAFQNFNAIITKHFFDVVGFLKSKKITPTLYYIDGNGMEQSEILDSLLQHWYIMRSPDYWKNETKASKLNVEIEVIQTNQTFNTFDLIKSINDTFELKPYDVIAFSNIMSGVIPNEIPQSPLLDTKRNIKNKMGELAVQYNVVVIGYEQKPNDRA